MLDLSLALQSVGSVLTVLGIYYGTTTPRGARVYASSCGVWWVWIVMEEMWGLVFLFIALTFVSIRSLWRTRKEA